MNFEVRQDDLRPELNLDDVEEAIYRSLVQTPSSQFQPDDCSEFFTKVKQPLPKDVIIKKSPRKDLSPKKEVQKKRFDFNQKALT